MKLVSSKVTKPTIWDEWRIEVVGEDGSRIEGGAVSEAHAEECRKRWECLIQSRTVPTKKTCKCGEK